MEIRANGRDSRLGALRRLADRQSAKLLEEIAGWLEAKGGDAPDAAMCRFIALHYELLAGHPEVRPHRDESERHRRRAIHWRFRAAVTERFVATGCGATDASPLH